MYRIFILSVLLGISVGNTALSQLEWKSQWKPFSTTQLITTPALMAGSFLLLNADSPNPANWKGGILFDGPLRDLFRLGSKGSRNSARTTGDILALLLVSYPYLVDSLANALIHENDTWVATQMSLVSTQSFFVAAFLTMAAKQLVGRERPYQGECGSDPTYDDQCNRNDSRLSFFSGHASLSFTAAGLICRHHEEFDLWGGSTTCYASMGAAVLASLSRCLADKHYTSDVLVGALVGWFAGYTLPKWLHYQDKPKPTAESQVHWAPVVSQDRIGFLVDYRF